MDVKARAKTTIRRVVRARGYDIVPVAGGIAALQQRLMLGTPTILDVGANVGQYAERLRDMGVTGRIISFEPGAEAYSTLSRRASRSEGGWEARNVALGASKGMATLRVSENSVSSSLLDVAEEHVKAAPRSRTAKEEAVQVSTLDEELSLVASSPFWLKLDVQGLEMQVLQGGPGTLKRTLAVQAEVSFTQLYEGQTDWLELCRYLTGLGFTLRYIEPGYEDRSSGYMLQADVLFVQGAPAIGNG